jgi:hypothetical protein
LLLEPAKQVWPQGISYLREEIVPEGYAGQVETIHSVNKHKQKALQFQHSPTKQLQGQLQARARQAEAKEIANRAIAKRRLQKALHDRDKAKEPPVSERDWMAELDHGMLYIETFVRAD